MTPSFKLGGIFFPLVHRTSLPLIIEFAWKFTPVLPLWTFSPLLIPVFMEGFHQVWGSVKLGSTCNQKTWCVQKCMYSNNFHKRIKIWNFFLISQGQYYIFLNFLKRSINPMNSLQSLVLLNEILQINL